MTDIANTRSLLGEFSQLLGVDETIDEEDPLWLQLAEIDIELTAAEVSEQRTDVHDPVRDTVRLKLIELNERMMFLAQDILGYYALVDEPPGSNEPPVGGDRAKRLRSHFLESKIGDQLEVMRLRDGLIRFLESHRQSA